LTNAVQVDKSPAVLSTIRAIGSSAFGESDQPTTRSENASRKSPRAPGEDLAMIAARAANCDRRDGSAFAKLVADAKGVKRHEDGL
jgi:hypothetical protein